MAPWITVQITDNPFLSRIESMACPTLPDNCKTLSSIKAVILEIYLRIGLFKLMNEVRCVGQLFETKFFTDRFRSAGAPNVSSPAAVWPCVLTSCNKAYHDLRAFNGLLMIPEELYGASFPRLPRNIHSSSLPSYGHCCIQVAVSSLLK